jgi:CheY-like chemotaxis protein
MRQDEKRRRVMVVDDDPSILITVKTVLEPEGFDVVLANSGDSCLEQLETGFSGVILMDVMMPNRDGWDTVREIADRGLLRGNAISMLTAMSAPDEKMDGLQEYVVDYITKPFSSDRLVTAVDEYLSYIED